MSVWATPEQSALLAALAERLDVRIVAAACPVRAHGPALADALSASLAGDVLDLLATDATLVLLATACEGFEQGLPQAVARAAAEGRRVATLAPLPMPPSDAAGPWHSPIQGRLPADAVRFGPLLRHGVAFQEASETLLAFGPVRSALFWGFRPWSIAGQGATGALLIDALDLLVGLLGEAERIDAAITGPAPIGSGLTLGPLTGDLTAHGRFEGGASAAILLSDRAGGWSRRVTLLGEAGRLELGDDGHRWIDPSGRTVDRSERRIGHEPQRPAESDAGPGHDAADGVAPEPQAVEALAQFLMPILDGRATPPLDARHLGPMAAAVLLSARTGQAESPSTLRAMV
ncbi:MAG: hypothetical protein KatS3mg103_0683 [Phycisphaerales bacterium]|nr:MAG: hypothetical protein KatS3mg103_0683 [Phycisphaerales bacterium]